jgi:1,4-alpha-glucan branching enzyme
MTQDIQNIIDQLIHSGHHDPFIVLGLHFMPTPAGEATAVIRTFQPHAESVQLVIGHKKKPLQKIRDQGFFEIVIPDCSQPFAYQFEATYYNKTTYTFYDPYRFLPQLGDIDLHLFNNGTHYNLYNKLGAQLTVIDSIAGTIFRVWAPDARRVSVIGNFNTWDGRVHQMRSLGRSGIWELFIPGIGQDELYKFEIKTQNDVLLKKSDPFQFYGEVRPRTGSIVRSLSAYDWHDEQWLAKRARTDHYSSPLSIYEVHPGSWRRDPKDLDRFLTFRELADSLVPYVKDMGFTHIELMPVMEHPLDESWGYQVTSYFSMSSRYGIPEDFMYFVDCCHQHNIGVILDWVPAHFPADGHSLARFDGTALYEHEDPRQGAHPEWGTLIFNYGRKEVSNFLIANALFWFDKYHIDGLRVDAVASMLYLDYARQGGAWVPNYYGGRENLEAIEFIKHLNSVLYEHFPSIMMIAEESTSFFGVSKPANLGGLGFGFKWNMGWMNDTLAYFSKDPIYRKHHHNALTFSLYYAFSENFILPLSHDEVVHGKRSLLSKMPGDKWQQFANLRLLFLLLWCHPGKKVLFMGGEFGQWSEWYCKRSLDWHLLEEDKHHRLLQDFVRHVNDLYKRQPSLWEIDFSHPGFKWMDFQDVDNSIISFARFAKNQEDHLVCVFNFTPQTHQNYKVGVPTSKNYREILNSDAAHFGGSNVKTERVGATMHEPFGQASHHVTVAIPPLGGIILQPQPS